MSKPKRKPVLNVVPLRDVCAADIAAQFRRMADELDGGQIANFESMVAVGEYNNQIHIYGWGKTDGMRAMGLLALGQAKLNREVLDYLDGQEAEQ